MTEHGDRRASGRRPGASVHAIRGVRLRTGQSATLVDASPGGIAIETEARLAPGSPLDVVVLGREQVRTARAFIVYARVVRLDPNCGVRYRVGLRLEPTVCEGVNAEVA